MPVVLITLPANMRLEVNQTTEGPTARIAPVTLTPTGMEILCNKNDLWTFNNQGFLVRVHRTTRKALFMPDSRCPVPTDRLENYRRTVIHRPNNNTEVIEEAYQDFDKKQQKRTIQGNNWTGETWFKVQSEKGNTSSRQHTTTTSTSTSQRVNTNNISTTHSQTTTRTNVSTQREEASH